MAKKGLLFLVSALLLGGCHRAVVLSGAFKTEAAPSPPNYAQARFWAALPKKTDPADEVPRHSGYQNTQATAQADVFFIHPTVYTGAPPAPDAWNADLSDSLLNARVDAGTIRNQASVFNGSCRVYAPRYRQAHYYVFQTTDDAQARKALDLAYADVRTAFEYYLAQYNQGRPIVVASHSQGTVHAVRLMQEFFDGKPLQAQLVGAYLVGKPIPAGTFKHLPGSERPGQPGAVSGWCTFRKGFTPTSKFFTEGLQTALSTNPLRWDSGPEYAPNTANRGGVGLKFTFAPRMSDAQNHQHVLWISRPNVRGSWLLRTKSWHVADYNLFYGNIRENVALQLKNYLAATALTLPTR